MSAPQGLFMKAGKSWHLEDELDVAPGSPVQAWGVENLTDDSLFMEQTLYDLPAPLFPDGSKQGKTIEGNGYTARTDAKKEKEVRNGCLSYSKLSTKFSP